MNNPVIPGFNPDPSICRCGDTYYCATSSFQWFPGVPIYRSTDLRHWRLYSYGLQDAEAVPLVRIQDSAGVWAPSLTYADGLFWLVFPVANGGRLHVYECDNYLSTAPDPAGPWSAPVYLHSLGNDPCLFHDTDGRKYVASTLQAFCPDDLRHLGIAVQEYSVAERRLVGPRRLVFEGVKGVPEGAKMYRRNDWYYLMIAEGGTGYEHQVTMARSRSVWGPYTVHPDNPILTASGTDNPIQRAGHGDMVRVDDRAWAFVYLASRPVGHYSILGRETFIARGEWGADDWFRLDSRAPLTEVPDFGPATSDSGTGFQEARDEFDAPEPGLCWNSPRLPLGDRIDLRTRPSWLGLRGTPSCFHSLNRPTLLAQRVRHLSFRAETLMDFRPQQPGQWAGLICYYDTRRFFACCRLLDSRGRDTVTVLGRYGVTYGFDLATGVPLETNSSLVRLVVVGDGLRFRFGCATPGENEAIRWIDAEAECRFLSDEYAEETEPPDPIPTFGFTGTMVGLGCFDATGTADTAYFDYFDYQGDQDG